MCRLRPRFLQFRRRIRKPTRSTSLSATESSGQKIRGSRSRAPRSSSSRNGPRCFAIYSGHKCESNRRCRLNTTEHAYFPQRWDPGRTWSCSIQHRFTMTSGYRLPIGWPSVFASLSLTFVATANPPPAPEPSAMARLAEDVHAVLAAWKFSTQPLLVVPSAPTYSMNIGGGFRQQIAAFVCTCGKPQPDSAGQSRHATRIDACRPATRRTGKILRSHGGYTDWPLPTASPVIRTAARDMMNTMSLPALLAVQQGLMERPDSVPTLTTINVPICV